MTNFICNSCGEIVDAVRGMPPIKCPVCHASKGFSKAKAASSKTASGITPMTTGKDASGESAASSAGKPVAKPLAMPGAKKSASQDANKKSPTLKPKVGNTLPTAGRTPSTSSPKPKAITPQKAEPTSDGANRSSANPALPKSKVAGLAKTPKPVGKPITKPLGQPKTVPPKSTTPPQTPNRTAPIPKPRLTPSAPSAKPSESTAKSKAPPAKPVSTPTVPTQRTTDAGQVKGGQAATANDSRIVWTFASPAGERAEPLRACVAVDDRPRVFACLENQVVMFMANDKGELEKRWEYATGDRIPGPPVIDTSGKIRVHSRDGNVHVIDSGGKPCHDPVRVGEPLNDAAPLVDHDDNTWVCRFDGGLARIQPDGTTDRRPFLRTRQRFDCTGAIVGNNLYVGSESGCVYAIDLSQKRGENHWRHADEKGRTGWYIHSAIAVTPDGKIIVASHDDSLYCFDNEGSTVWRTAMPGKMLGSPVIDSAGTIYIGLGMDERGTDGRGALAAIESNSGRIRWQAETAGRVESTPVIGDDGIVYFGDNTAHIHAVDAQGKRQWSQSVAARVRSAGTICGDKILLFGLDDGSLVGLRCSSHCIAKEGWPKLLASGEQRGWPLKN